MCSPQRTVTHCFSSVCRGKSALYSAIHSPVSLHLRTLRRYLLQTSGGEIGFKTFFFYWKKCGIIIHCDILNISFSFSFKKLLPTPYNLKLKNENAIFFSFYISLPCLYPADRNNQHSHRRQECSPAQSKFFLQSDLLIIISRSPPTAWTFHRLQRKLLHLGEKRERKL